ncbi:MAG: YibE/F family protein, partial [Eubacterium sp.]|nr:YibE/F family protein [Eubacterium sp.]
IDRKLLVRSGKEIGKDIMGTMANILVFAYISGSIPMIVLWLKNGYSTFNILSYNLSLEIIRALTGSIGIVVSIPITLYISIFLLTNKRTGVKS